MPRRKFWGALITVLCVVSAIVGILTGLPQLIAQYWDRIPTWLTSPNTVWVASLTAVGTIAVLLILEPWRRETQHEFQPDLSKVEWWIIYAIDQALNTEAKAIESRDMNTINSTTLHSIDHSIPTFLQSALGKSERNKYTAVIDSARSSGITRPHDLLGVAISHLHGLVAKEIMARFASATIGTRLESPVQP